MPKGQWNRVYQIRSTGKRKVTPLSMGGLATILTPGPRPRQIGVGGKIGGVEIKIYEPRPAGDWSGLTANDCRALPAGAAEEG